MIKRCISDVLLVELGTIGQTENKFQVKKFKKKERLQPDFSDLHLGRQRESIIGVQWGQGNPNPRVHRSSGKQGLAEFPTGTVDPRVGISRFHCTPMIDSISHISNKE